jgi:hypothetical protein
VDYQEFAPLPGGNIGSSQQSMILHRKGSGKGPAVMMRQLSEAFRNYGILPRGTSMRFNDRDEQEALERQEVRTKAMEEMAIAVSRKIITPEAAAKSMVRRKIWDEDDIKDISPEFWKAGEMGMQNNGQLAGGRGGNTIAEDSQRQDTGIQSETTGDRLRKAWSGLIGDLRAERDQEHDQRLITALSKAMGTVMGTVKKDQPIVVNVPAPQITNNIPQQPAPIVNVSMPETNLELKMPRIKTQVQKVVRDAQDNITHTVTETTYEE